MPPSTGSTGPPPFPNTAFDIVVFAASLGGLQALTPILSALPATFPAAIAIVQHISPDHNSVMAEILDRRTALKVKQAREADQLQPGVVYIAPPDKHLLVNDDATLSLSDAPREHFVRPAGNKLFETAALHLRERVIAVVLTGMDSDGATGAVLVKKMGGIVIAQDASTAEAPSMPRATIETGVVDFVLPVEEIATMLLTLVKSIKPT